REPTRKSRADGGKPRANERRQRSTLRDAEPVAGERECTREVGGEPRDLPKARGVDPTDPGVVEHPVALERLDHSGLHTALFEVDLQPGPWQPLGEERERLVERRQVRGEPAQAVERPPPDATPRRPVADLTQIGG